MSIAVRVAGFCFLAIIILLQIGEHFGYKTAGETDIETKLVAISENPRKFKIGVFFVIAEHCVIILLALSLYLAYGTLNPMLGIMWCVFRITEAGIQLYDKCNYWRLRSLAQQYSQGDLTVITKGTKILQTRYRRFSIAQLCFSAGTFTYSLLFILNDLVPLWLAWGGLVSSLIYAVGNLFSFNRSSMHPLWALSGLLIFLFELTLGVWLLFFPH